jgi:hypothetical protein
MGCSEEHLISVRKIRCMTKYGYQRLRKAQMGRGQTLPHVLQITTTVMKKDP